ncbi:sugar phosphate isomerase/epimerase family protein (plasmid) [Haloferacaceae archaeon DSL9]
MNASRRHVLQAIGGAGVAGALGTGQVSGRTPQDGRNFSLQASGDDIQISTQFWTYAENSDLSVAELIRESADAGYDAVEPFTLNGEEEIATALDETGIGMSSAHVGIETLEDDFEGTIETYSEFGASALIHAYKGDGTWESEDGILEWADRVNEMADRVADEGLEFGYHNHDFEFAAVGDDVGYDIFAESVNDNVHLQLDAGWVLAGGEDPIEYIERYSDKISSIHMKNMTADGDFTEIHEGDVNMRAVANIARNEAGVDYLVYEYDAAPEPIESMNTGAEWLSQLSRPFVHGPICGIEGAEGHPVER